MTPLFRSMELMLDAQQAEDRLAVCRAALADRDAEIARLRSELADCRATIRMTATESELRLAAELDAAKLLRCASAHLRTFDTAGCLAPTARPEDPR